MNQQSILLVPGAMLVVQPALADVVGLKEALFLQQLHYWLQQRPHFHDDKPWIYNTIDQWCMQFTFWSRSTLERIIRSLRKQNLIITTTKYNQFTQDRKLWYTLNYDEISSINQPKSGHPTRQIDVIQDHINLTDSERQNEAFLDHVNLTGSERQNEGFLQHVNLTASNIQIDGMDHVNLKDSSIYRRLTTETTTDNTITTTTDARDPSRQDETEAVVVVVSHPPEVVELIEIGIPEPKAVEFFNARGEAYIREKIEILNNQPDVRFPSRWLLAALEKDFQPENYSRPDPTAQERHEFAQQLEAEQQAYRAQQEVHKQQAQQAEMQRFQELHSQHGVSQHHFAAWNEGIDYCKEYVLNSNRLLSQALEATVLLDFRDNHARIGVLDSAMMFQLDQRGKQFIQEAIAYAMRDEMEGYKITYQLEQL